jgi:hypothetical protein
MTNSKPTQSQLSTAKQREQSELNDFFCKRISLTSSYLHLFKVSLKSEDLITINSAVNMIFDIEFLLTDMLEIMNDIDFVRRSQEGCDHE